MRSSTKLLPEVDDLAHGDGGVQDGGVDLLLAQLDALGDLDLAFAAEDRYAPQPAEIDAEGVVRLGVVVGALLLAVPRAAELLAVRLAVGDALRRDLHLRRGVNDSDVLVAQGAHDVAKRVGADGGGQRVVVGEEAVAPARLHPFLERLAVLLAGAVRACRAIGPRARRVGMLARGPARPGAR
jgi:hypothetical protein